MVDEYGRKGFLERISDPYWFQALGNVLGYDWHSSGVTTVLTGVLKNAIDPGETGIAVCGGKGATSLKTPMEIRMLGEKFNIPEWRLEGLVRVSRLVAKVDNAVVQDGYSLYHHAMFITEEGYWAVVQQGLNPYSKTARRYHWLHSRTASFVEEPHYSVVSDRVEQAVLNLTAAESRGVRKASVDLAVERPSKIARDFSAAVAMLSGNELLVDLEISREALGRWRKAVKIPFLKMPRTLNWEAVKRLYDVQPRNYEELIEVNGVGPATLRGLALISSLIYGEEASWRDPVKYSFAFGGKDGVPFPVNRKAMDEAISFLEESIRAAEIGYREKIEALKRLRVFVDRG